MNTQQARALIGETFPQTFDKGRFRYFAVNLLNHIDENKAQAWNTTSIKDAFKPHVHKFERLGTYTSPDKEKLDVLIVHLTTESKLGRARTAIRNFVADYLKISDNKDAALVAFVSPTEKQWRFSYVKMEYAAVEKENGKVGVQTTLTPARRSSYIVGEGESCHTAQSRFIDLLRDTENHPTLAQIENAFSVEAVTTEFFEQYKALFLDLNDELDNLAKKDKTIGAEFAAKKISTADFAKKLMGQIVFLYFLQKKGWLGVAKGGDWGGGPHNFLRQLFDGRFGGHKNFFNDILEPLFYDTLATDRSHEKDFCKIFKCRIPFLNGGLFEPLRDYDWKKTDIIVPNEIFSNNKRTKDDIGTGILDVFDRYNFTVNEAEPLEKEVAIDPEMLGKVFENLLEVKERKSKGSFYTPREIVHYMCQESLINYLDTALNTDKEIVPRKDIETFIYLGEQISHYEAVDAKYPIKMPATIEKYARLIDEKLATITVCDPAIGSGAFPVSMMQEIVRARSSLTNYLEHEIKKDKQLTESERDKRLKELAAKTTIYALKKHAIQNSLYGVDIDPGAVEIAKLRLWLSLVVDEEDVKQIKPLPNLDYKIVTGNSLLGVEKTLFNEKLFKRLEELKPRYLNEAHKDKKDAYKRDIDNLIHELTSGKEAFDFEIYFSEVYHKKGGFDVVIGNPPYLVLSADFPNLDYFEKRYYVSQGGKKNLYKLFFERGLKLLRPNGALSFISPNNYLTSADSVALRDLLAQETCMQEIIEYSESDRVFDAVTQAVCTIVLVKCGIRNKKISYFKNGAQTFIDQNEILKHPLRFIKNPSPIAEKMERQKYRLIDFIVGFQGEMNVSTKKEFFTNKPNSSKHLPLVRGKQVKRFYTVDFPAEYCSTSVQSRDHYDQERVVFQEVSNAAVERRVNGTIMSNVLCGHTTNYLLSKSPKVSNKFLLGWLNSRLTNFYFKFYNQTNHIPIGEIKQIPVPDLPSVEQKRIIALVDRILAAKQHNAKSDTGALEREIDELVYALYSLTQEEIALIEAAS